jgi:hypothetical protein
MRVEGPQNPLVAPIRKNIVVAVLGDAVEKCDLGGFLLQTSRWRLCQRIVDPKYRLLSMQKTAVPGRFSRMSDAGVERSARIPFDGLGRNTAEPAP